MTIPDLDHYDLLELPRDATHDDVERAYRVARATWADGALATYSVADANALDSLRARVEHAYRVLSDADARGAYDAALGRLRAEPSGEPDPDLGLDEPEKEELTAAELPREIEAFDDLSGPEDGRWTGPALRRTRLARGLELDQINQTTKVSPLHLRNIEEERFELLPAAVYVRGFVTAYARCLGLDAGRVANDYLERLAAAKPDRSQRRRR